MRNGPIYLPSIWAGAIKPLLLSIRSASAGFEGLWSVVSCVAVKLDSLSSTNTTRESPMPAEMSVVFYRKTLTNVEPDTVVSISSLESSLWERWVKSFSTQSTEIYLLIIFLINYSSNCNWKYDLNSFLNHWDTLWPLGPWPSPTAKAWISLFFP